MIQNGPNTSKDVKTQITVRQPGAPQVPLKSLSRVRCESHARFLGDGGPAMGCCYPTVLMPSSAPKLEIKLY